MGKLSVNTHGYSSLYASVNPFTWYERVAMMHLVWQSGCILLTAEDLIEYGGWSNSLSMYSVLINMGGFGETSIGHLAPSLFPGKNVKNYKSKQACTQLRPEIYE